MTLQLSVLHSPLAVGGRPRSLSLTPPSPPPLKNTDGGAQGGERAHLFQPPYETNWPVDELSYHAGVDARLGQLHHFHHLCREGSRAAGN